MKMLYANGDSNTHGDELGEDELGHIDYKYREEHSYVGQLAKLFQVPLFTNDAIGGGSNDRMVRRTMKFTSEWLMDGNHPRDLFVVIGWSNVTRREFYYEPNMGEGDEFNKHDMYKWAEEESRYRRTFVSMHKSKRTHYDDNIVKDFFTLYNRWFSHLPSSTTRSVNQIIGLQCYLKQMKIPYLFFNAAWFLRIEKSQCGPLACLIDETRFLGAFDKHETMHGWTRKNGFGGRLERNHPDEAAHAGWAKRLYDHIIENKLDVIT